MTDQTQAEVIESGITRKHKWGEPKWIPGGESSTGCDQTARTCQCCGLVKITVHPPDGSFPYRAWRHRNGQEITLTNTPPCVDEVQP
jgi:hypothetical protein